MRTLKFRKSFAATPSSLEEQRPFRAWHDETGNPCANGYRVGRQSVMDWPSLGRYVFSEGAATVDVEPLPGVPRTVLVDAFHRFVLPLTLLADGFEVLHASAVLTPAGVVAFCADCEGGKSTVAFELSRLGLPQWADDAVALRVEAGGVWTTRLPFEPRLRHDSAAHFGTAATRARPESPVADSDASMAAICVLSRGESQDVHLETLSGSGALVALLNHARVLDPADEPRKKQMLTRYLEAAASVPVMALTIPSGFHRLTPALLDLGARLAWWETPAEHPCLT